MPLVIYRQPLADKGERTEVSRYSYVTLFAGNKLIEQAAADEAAKRDDCRSLAVRETKVIEGDYDVIRHHVCLMGHRSECLAEYYGEWPMDEDTEE